MAKLEIGLDTFGDRTRGADGGVESHARVIRNLIEQAELADRLGLAFFGVGEHHREDFAVSAPEVVLAAIAGRTSQRGLSHKLALRPPGIAATRRRSLRRVGQADQHGPVPADAQRFLTSTFTLSGTTFGRTTSTTVAAKALLSVLH
jgi:hypothetical protein